MRTYNNILVVSPHPDDETLGCGGTIVKHGAAGDRLYWLIMTNISEGKEYGKERVVSRQKEIGAVAGDYGFKRVFKLDLPTTTLDTVPKADMVKMARRVIDAVRPRIIYVPHKNDAHSDHGVTFDVLASATKTFRSPFIEKVLAYEVISETEFSPQLKESAFLPNSFSDITGYLDRKIRIMSRYKGELGRHPFPRSARNIKALATFRGATAGTKYAEAFMILKERW